MVGLSHAYKEAKDNNLLRDIPRYQLAHGIAGQQHLAATLDRIYGVRQRADLQNQETRTMDFMLRNGYARIQSYLPAAG